MKLMPLRRAVPLLVSALLGVAVLIPAAAPANDFSGFGNPRRINGPSVITKPGAYRLQRSITLHHAGTAILIAADNVSLDLAGHTLAGPGNQGIGIHVKGVSGARVRGGIVSGFAFGVQVEGATNVRIEGLQILGGDLGGPPPGEVGVMLVNSRAIVIERNVVSGTFLGIFVRGGGSGGNRLGANTLTGGGAGQIGICYNPDASGSPAGPGGDLVYNNLVSRFQVGIQTSPGTAGNVFSENSIAFFGSAIEELLPGSNLFADNQDIQIVP
jgi:hypothetical protein